MVTRTLDFVWSSYASLHMLAGSPPEKLSKVFSYREIRKQLINCLIVLLLWARTWYWSLSRNSLSTNRSNIWVCLVSLVYWTLKNDHNQSNFVDSVKSLCQQTFKVNSEQMCRHCLSSKCHVSFKMRTSLTGFKLVSWNPQVLTCFQNSPKFPIFMCFISLAKVTSSLGRQVDLVFFCTKRALIQGMQLMLVKLK